MTAGFGVGGPVIRTVSFSTFARDAVPDTVETAVYHNVVGDSLHQHASAMKAVKYIRHGMTLELSPTAEDSV